MPCSLSSPCNYLRTSSMSATTFGYVSSPHAIVLSPEKAPVLYSMIRCPNFPSSTPLLQNAVHNIQGISYKCIGGRYDLGTAMVALHRVFSGRVSAGVLAGTASEDIKETIGVGELGCESSKEDFGRVLKTLGHSCTLENLDNQGTGRPGDIGASFAAGWESSERVLGCCERGENLKVAVLVSGGVDSSVALRLLCAAGHTCTAFYLKIWFQEDFENFWSECPWEEDLKYAQAVCDEVGVELRVVHFTDEYWKLVVSHSIAEIQAGRTPNPDILCNSCIKFGAFLEHIQDAHFDRVASGHYARVRSIFSSTAESRRKTELLLSSDEVKDQTYFLSHLRQEQLTHLMFPLGQLSKVEVRQLAEAMGLYNKHRKDSQGICFLGKVKFNEFIAKHLGEREGRLLEAETGELLGLHKGFWFYTIGQRQGLCLSNGPWFVVAKDVSNNVVYISRKYYTEDKRRRTFCVSSFNWFLGSPSDTSSLQCKVRHGARLYDCSIQFGYPHVDSRVNEANISAVVNISEDDQGLAPGQYVAFYRQGVCLGSAIITEELGGAKNLDVSAQALEIARQPFNLALYKSSKPKLSNSLRVSGSRLPNKAAGVFSTDLEQMSSAEGTLTIDEKAGEAPINSIPGVASGRIEAHIDPNKFIWTQYLQRFLQAVLPK